MVLVLAPLAGVVAAMVVISYLTRATFKKPIAQIWMGPVSPGQVKGATLQGIPTYYISCTGDGSPSCAQIADQFLDSEGNRLPNIRKKFGIPENGPLALAAYSAGGHIVRRILQSAKDSEQIALITIADGTYSTVWKNKGEAEPIKEYVKFLKGALEGNGSRFVATASSSPNKNYPTASQTIEAIAKEAGVKSTEQSSVLPIGFKKAWAGRGVELGDYGQEYTHAAHATGLAPLLYANLNRDS